MASVGFAMTEASARRPWEPPREPSSLCRPALTKSIKSVPTQPKSTPMALCASKSFSVCESKPRSTPYDGAFFSRLPNRSKFRDGAKRDRRLATPGPKNPRKNLSSHSTAETAVSPHFFSEFLDLAGPIRRIKHAFADARSVLDTARQGR